MQEEKVEGKETAGLGRRYAGSKQWNGLDIFAIPIDFCESSVYFNYWDYELGKPPLCRIFVPPIFEIIFVRQMLLWSRNSITSGIYELGKKLLPVTVVLCIVCCTTVLPYVRAARS